jgi:molybdenum cofactor cytidylyltransferase
MISAVVLAAAQTQPWGESKLFLPLRGKPALQWILESALTANLDEIICVTNDLKSVQRQIFLADKRLFWLMHYAGDRERNKSVIAGLWASNPTSDGVMFLAGDQPLIPTELINSLIERFLATSAWIVAPSFNGEARHPLLLHRRLFPELLKLGGNLGANALLDKHRKKTSLVEWQDRNSFLHLDAGDDFELIKEYV